MMLQDPKTHFFSAQNSRGTRKNFSENYRQFGHVVSGQLHKHNNVPIGLQLNSCSELVRAP
jgi:hypothetical protein